MGKYNFNYDRIQSLEARNQQLATENSNLKNNVEQLSKAMEALAKEVIALKEQQGGVQPKPKKGFTEYIGEETMEKLFNVKPAFNSVVEGDSDITKSNATTFYSNIVRAISPFSRVNSTSGNPYLTGKPLKLMTEQEADIIGKAIAECAKICSAAKDELEGIKDE